jgi:hypothetical protein
VYYVFYGVYLITNKKGDKIMSTNKVTMVVYKEPIHDIKLIYIEDNTDYETYICFEDRENTYRVRLLPDTKIIYLDKCTCHGCGHDTLSIGKVVTIKGCPTHHIKKPSSSNIHYPYTHNGYEFHMDAQELIFEKQPSEYKQIEEYEIDEHIRQLI